MAMTAPQGSGRLPFWSTVNEALTLPFRHAGEVARLTWLWGLLLASLTGALYYLLDPDQVAAMQKGDTFGPIGLNLLSLLIGLIVGASVAVGWHRLLLRGERIPGTTYLRLDNTVWHYIAVAGLMLVATLPFLAASYVLSSRLRTTFGPLEPPSVTLTEGQLSDLVLWPLAVLASLALAVLLTTRLSLVLPARAVDHQGFTLADSWRLTQGSFWRLFAGTLVCYLPAMLLAGLVGGAIGGDGDPARFLLWNMASAVVGLVTSVFPLGFLSLAYKHLSGPAPTDGGPSS